MIEPDDISLITGASEERRRFLDTLLSQLYPEYLQQLINYNRILLQRNSCLKNIFERQINGNDLLDVLDIQLADCGQFIFLKREQFLKTLIPLAIQQYQTIAGKDENIAVQYQSQLFEQPLMELLKANRQRDLYAQRTTTGIHKDDFILLMDEEPFKQMASQGQRKSLLFALKFAEFFAIQKIKKQSPVLLLDDVFEKLDEERLMNLMHKICNETDAQVFITDTHKARFYETFSRLNLDYQLIEL
jgi:DNA replication and repair protein RecF